MVYKFTEIWKLLLIMIYAPVDTFYLTDEELRNSPSVKDGIDEVTEVKLRIYGCQLIQETGILLKLPQVVMATGQVLFHRFYCKKSFVEYDVKSVAASCVWLASKLEESPMKARQVIYVFHRMERRREKLPLEHLDCTRYRDMKHDLIRTERHVLKELGFVSHVDHPHKFILSYLATLGTPPELRQEAWSLANDSLRTTLCLRFKSEVVACGVVYAAARRFQVPLPENPPWWEAFDADKAGIDEVCRALANLYSLPKPQYIPVCRKGYSFELNTSWDPPFQPLPDEESLSTCVQAIDNINTSSMPINTDCCISKCSLANEKLTSSKKSDDVEPVPIKPKTEYKMQVGVEMVKDRDSYRDRDREKERLKVWDRKRGRHSDRELKREDSTERYREKVTDRNHHSRDKGKDLGYADKLKHHVSREHDHNKSYSSRERDRHRHRLYS